MACEIKNREELAEDFVRGELCPEQQDEFEIHLLECSKCLGVVETLNELQFELRDRGEIIREAVIDSGKRFRTWVLVIVVAVVTAVAALGTAAKLWE